MGLSRLTTREVADRCRVVASALLPGAARAALLLTDAAAGAQGGAAARAATAMLMPAHRHFCVDEDPEEAARVMNRLRELGIGGIIDYAAEAAYFRLLMFHLPFQQMDTVFLLFNVGRWGL